MKNKKNILLLLFCIILSGCTVSNDVIDNEAIETREYMNKGVEIENAFDVPITTDYIDFNSTRRTHRTRDIMYIILHETDNYEPSANAANHNSLLHMEDGEIVGWHYTVDDISIYHSIPDDEAAFNSADDYTTPGGNTNGIAIEMCVNNGSDWNKTIDNTAKLVATLMKTYNLTIDDVKTHHDFDRNDKICPHRLLTENRWYEFLELVNKYYTSNE